jgi:hypothetical protein
LKKIELKSTIIINQRIRLTIARIFYREHQQHWKAHRVTIPIPKMASIIPFSTTRSKFAVGVYSLPPAAIAIGLGCIKTLYVPKANKTLVKKTKKVLRKSKFRFLISLFC